MIEFNEENHTFTVPNISNPVAYQDMSLRGEERALSYFKEITKEHIVFSTLVEGQKKQFSVQTKDLTSLGITKKALETIRNTKGSEHRFQALQNELLPKPPSHTPNPSLYSIAKSEEGKARAQKLYREKTDETIKELVKILDGNRRDNYFNCRDVLNKAATAREELAISQGLKDERFGVRRRPQLYAAIRGVMLTPLWGAYQEYGVALKKVIEKAVEGKTASELENGITIEEKEVSEEDYSIYLGYSITIRRVSAETILTQASGPEKYMENVSRTCKLGAFDAFIVSVTLLTRKWDESDATVKDISIPVSHYILPVPIEEMSTGLNMRWHGYPLLKKERLPIIVHADPSSFKDLEPMIGAQFNLCLQEEENTDLLKKKVAVLLYLMAQATFYQRGSAAIAEWVEQAIYQYHGFNVEYKHPDPSIKGKPSRDLDAFVSLTIL